MNQSQQQHRGEATQFMHNLGDAMTQGWHSILFRFFKMLVTINAKLISFFIRKRQGIHQFSFGLWFWVGGYLLVLVMISQHYWQALETSNIAHEFKFSGHYLYQHGQIFVLLMVIKWIIASFSLGSKNPIWFREKNSIGESILYPIVRALLPLSCFDHEINPQSWWKLNEERWMKYWEILILLIVALIFRNAGYIAYGNFLFFASLCLGWETFRVFQNTHSIKQAEMEARVMGGYLQARDSKNASGGRVISD